MYMTDKGFRASNIKNPANQKMSAFWMWMKEEGRRRFETHYGVRYEQTNKEHKDQIAAWWNDVKESDEKLKWEAMAKTFNKDAEKVKAMRESKKAEYRRQLALHPEEMHELKKAHDQKIREINPPMPKYAFGAPIKTHTRHTPNEVDIRCEKVFTYLTSKFQITMKNAGRGKEEDDVLRDLRSFLLIVHEYTSNVKGDRVCPAEVTLLSFSLSRGMQKLLSGVLTYEHSIVTDRDNLNESEYNTIVDTYENTGIAAERFIPQSKNPEGSGVMSLPRLKSELLGFLSDHSNNHTPIMLLKSNYNEAAGMLFTLFPDYWEHLETRFCFLDDLFHIYTRIQTGRSETHPIRDYSNLPLPPPCPFHLALTRKGIRGKKCTQQVAINELQILFKSLSDARVLKMDRIYERAKHEQCTQDDWDQHGPQIQWEQGERDRRIEDEMRSNLDDDVSNSDSDHSLEEGMPVVHDYDSRSDRNDVRRHNYDDERRGSNQTDRYDGRRDYGRREEYGSRDATKENSWNGESQNGSFSGGFGRTKKTYSGGGGNGRNSSDDGERGSHNRAPPSSSFSDRTGQKEPPFGYDEDARPAQRRRAASPTQSERGKGGREEERGRDSQRSDEERGGRGSREGGGGSISRPSLVPPRGRGVFGSRPVVEQQSQKQQSRAEPQERRGVFSKNPLFNSSSESWSANERTRGEPENFHREHNRLRSGHDWGNDGTRRMERETSYGGGRQTMRDYSSSPPPRDGAKRREDRLNPEFGGPTNSSGPVFSREMVSPQANIPAKKKEAPKEESPKDREEAKEDRDIRNTVKMLPRGTFDKQMKDLMRKREPRVTPTFRPLLWSAAIGSNGVPLEPYRESTYEEEVRNLNRNGGGQIR